VVKVEGLVEPGSASKAQLVDLQGNILREILFVPRIDDQFTFDWINFVAPPGLFYIRIVGRDSKGYEFHRCSTTAISAILPGWLF
jgi:hemicentin